MVRSEIIMEVPSVGFGAEGEQGLCIPPISVDSCMPFIEEGKQKLVVGRY